MIEKKLRAYFKKLVKKYEWIEIKFEFNEDRNVYMVSYSPKEKIIDNDDFNRDAMKFADDMNKKYGNNAPLFCDEEAYFKLSDKAEIIKKKKL